MSNASDPICGNCFKKKSAHYFEDETYCYTDTTGDVFTDEPQDRVIFDMMTDKQPELYEQCVAEWRLNNGHGAGE